MQAAKKKKKGGGSKKAKRPAQGAGAAASAKQEEEEAAQPAVSALTPDASEVQLEEEQVSGAGAHAPTIKLDPVQAAANGAAAPAASADPFLRVGDKQWAEARLQSSASNEAVLKGLLDATAASGLDAFVGANRDYLNKRFQVWLMAEALRHKGAGNGAQEQDLRAALSDLVKANRAFDETFASALAGREAALNKAFEAANLPDEQKPTIVDLAGQTAIDQLALWAVIAAAREAWVDRLSEIDDDDRSLREAITRKVGQMEQFLEAIALSPQIQPPPVGVLLAAVGIGERKEQRVDDRVIFSIGCIAACLECLRYQSYSALAKQLISLYDELQRGQPNYLSTGDFIDPASALSSAAEDGSLSSLIRYEIEQQKIDSRDSTVKLGDLLGLSSEQ